jgi:chloride channel protein, CIC family
MSDPAAPARRAGDAAAAPPGQPLGGGAYLRLIGLGAAIGIPAALVAALFQAFVHELEGWLWDDLPDALGYSSPPWFLVVFLPVAGAVVVILARRLLPGDGGHMPLKGLSADPTPLRYAPGVALAAIGTLGFGAVLGPEAPLIALGSAVGMGVTLFVRLGPQEQGVLSAAGSFSAVSALFGGPLVAGMLLLEAGVAKGRAIIPALLPGLVAAAIGYVLFVGLGDWGGLNTVALTVPGLPEYKGTHIGDLVIAVGVGLAAAILITAVRLVGTRVAAAERRLGMAALLIAGGLAVGVVAELADLLGADSQEVLFSGQASVPAEIAEGSAGILLVLVAAKAIGYAVSLGCGFRGGPVFPAIFLGTGLATFAEIAFDTSPTLALAVGAAAGMTAMTRLLFASLLFSALLVGRAGIDAIPAAVLAACAAWVAMMAIDKRTERSDESPVGALHAQA